MRPMSRGRLPSAGGNGHVAEGYQQVSVVRVAVAGVVPGRRLVPVFWRRQGDLAGQGVADGYAPELGQGGQGGVRQIPSKARVWD